MEKFEKITKRFEGDFYSIYEEDGVKYIHVYGYTYKSDSEEFVTEENPNGIYWANFEVSWFIFSLAFFVESYREKGVEFVNEVYECRSQYQGDLTEKEMVETINRYFNGHTADAYLSFGELTEDTPCGDYVNTSKTSEPEKREYKGVTILRDLDYVGGHWYNWKIQINISPVSSKPLKRTKTEFERFVSLKDAKKYIDYFTKLDC